VSIWRTRSSGRCSRATRRLKSVVAAALETTALALNSRPSVVRTPVARPPLTSTSAFVIAQHMPDKFTRTFAERLDRRGPIRVSEAQDGDLISVRTAFVCPGRQCMEVFSAPSGELRLRVAGALSSDRYVPSADRLLTSLAKTAGPRAVGLVLTYQATGVFNFAFGAQAYVSAFIFTLLVQNRHMPIWLAFFLSVIVLAPAYSGAGTLRSLLEGHPDLACTAGTGLLPLCEQALATWRSADGRPAGAGGTTERQVG